MSRASTLSRAVPLVVLAACNADDAMRPMASTPHPHSAVATASTSVEIVSAAALPLIPGATNAQANDVTDAGVIVGAQYGGQYFGWHPLRWTGTAAPTYITNPGFFATANAVTPDGLTAVGGLDVLGEFPSQYAPVKFVSPTTSYVNLTGRCCGADRGQALGVNAAGKIVGYYRKQLTPGVPDREIPALWNGTTETDLLAGQSSGRAYDINNSDVVIGQRTEGPFRWQSGAITPLPTLGAGTTTPLSINDANVIVGVSASTAVRWIDGSIAALSGIPGSSRANDINDFGQIVGLYVDPGTSAVRAFLWSEDLGFVDLGPGAATAVNNRGVVVGTIFGAIPVPGGTSGAAPFRWTLNFAPVARLTGPEDEVKKKESIAFSAAGSTDQNLDALTYAWDFGDGSTGTGATTTHSYNKQGDYTVTVTVSDPRGLTSTASLDVSVENGKKPKKNPGNNGNNGNNGNGNNGNNGNGNGPKKP